MNQIFLATYCHIHDHVRHGMLDAVLARLKMEPDCRVIIINPDITHAPALFPCNRETFFAKAMLYADVEAEGPYMFFADDTMPLGPNFFNRGLSLLEKNPRFLIIGSAALGEPEGDPDVFEFTEMAGPYIVRTPGIIRSVLTDEHLNQKSFNDRNLTQVLNHHGHHVGKTTNQWIHNHFGAWLSTTWPDDYKSGMTQINWS